jgi:2-oxoglutarate ferredoxin oxidoreductase subunit delta
MNMATKGKPVIDRERCKGCLLCARSCPMKVLAADESPNSWGYYPSRAVAEEKCIACGNCYQVCPDVAITVYRS